MQAASSPLTRRCTSSRPNLSRLEGGLGAKATGPERMRRFEPVLGQLAQAAFGVALRVMDLGGVDTELPVSLLSNARYRRRSRRGWLPKPQWLLQLGLPSQIV